MMSGTSSEPRPSRTMSLTGALLVLAVLLLLSFVIPLVFFLPRLSLWELLSQIGDGGLVRAVGVSLGSATVAVSVMGALGIPLGYLLARDEIRFPRTVRVLVLLPLVLPPVAAGVLLLNVYGPEGLIGAVLGRGGWTLTNTLAGIVLAQIFVAAPFVVLSAEAAFRAVDPGLEQAAATLGRTRAETFRRVSLPLAQYGLGAGLALAWMRAAGEFGATMVMAYHPHSLPVYLWVELSGRGLTAALPVALVALVLAAIVLFVAQGLTMRERSAAAAAVLRGPAHEPAPESGLGAGTRPEASPIDAGPAGAESMGEPDGSTVPTGPALSLDLEYRIGEFSLSVTLAAGREILSLFGPSGAGKTTLLRLISGLARPDAGWIRLDDVIVFRGGDGPDVWAPAHRRPVGMVFQHHALFPHLSVRENILFGAAADDARAAARAAELLRMTRLDGLEGRRPHELSGGQQQRVALARALIRRPRVLLLDEPFSSLDSNMKERLLLDVRRIHEAMGVCVIYVTHDLRDACSLGDRLAVIDGGRILQVGPPLEVVRRPASYAVARFVGVRNLFEGEVVSSEEGRAVVRTAGLELEAMTARRLRAGERVYFGVRPEDVVFLKPDRPLRPPADENVLEGEVVLDRLRGPTYTLTFRVDAPAGTAPLELEIELPVRSYVALGIRSERRWRVSIRRSALHVLGS